MLGTSKQGDKEAKRDTVSQQVEAPANSKAQETVNYLLYNDENTLSAEISWYLRMVSSHESYNSCSDLSEIFQRMFFDSEIAAKFSLGKTKSRYPIWYGVAPESKRVLLYDVKLSQFFTVSFDESLNTDLQVCCTFLEWWEWSCWNKIFWLTIFQKANCSELIYHCKSTSEPEEKLATDGPNVNWTLLDLLDDKLVSDNFSKTLNIGSCANLLFMVH